MMWHRVFGTKSAPVEPERLLAHLQSRGLNVSSHSRGDDQGWFRVELRLEGEEAVALERFLATEEGIRPELNSWAAWLETVQDNPHAVRLMLHMVNTAQVFTVQAVADTEDPEQCQPLAGEICRFLAGETAGVYQVDGQGFFAADGTLLVPEPAE
jgi:hypothetical protein